MAELRPCKECASYDGCCKNSGWTDAQWDRAYLRDTGHPDCFKEGTAMAETYYKGFCKPPKWDVNEGKRLYDAGMRVCDIARALGASHNAVQTYARRHWSPAALGGYRREGNDNG